MAKYLEQVAGALREVKPIAATTGVTDKDKIVQTDATGKLDASLMPTGISADTFTGIASEALAAGDFVNIYDNVGVANVRKADASVAGKSAHGYVSSGVILGDPATVYFEGTNTQVVGMTVGKAFLSTTPGLATNTAPTTAGNVSQIVGIAVGATQINLQLSDPITLA
jgi:hypothetical protein